MAPGRSSALRLEEAKRLLESSDEPVDEIGCAVGYEDPSFFRRLFKRRTGISPGRYRRVFQPIHHERPASRARAGERLGSVRSRPGNPRSCDDSDRTTISTVSGVDVGGARLTLRVQPGPS